MPSLKNVHVVLLACTMFIFVTFGPCLGYYRRLETRHRFRRTVRAFTNAAATTLVTNSSNHSAIEITKRNLDSVDFNGKRIVCLGKNLEEKVKAFRHSGALAVGVDFDPGDNSGHVLLRDITSSGFATGSVDVIYCNSIQELLKHMRDDKDFVQRASDMLADDGLFWVDF